VICTRNRPTALRNCINALLASSDTDFELVVVDNNPSDNSTELVVKEFKDVKYFLEPRKGLDIARNTGAYHATKNIVAYTDDDVVVHKDWIKELKTSFSNPLTMAVTGLVLPLSLDTKTQYILKNTGDLIEDINLLNLTMVILKTDWPGVFLYGILGLEQIWLLEKRSLI